MHSASSRFNGITLFTCLVLAIMCGINFFHGTHIYTPEADVTFQIDNITNFIKTVNWDQASMKYNMTANLSKLYTWNLKQLYVYIEFEWRDLKSNLTSRTITSDWILQIPATNKEQIKDSWVIKVENQRMEYLLRDVHFGLRGNTVNISLNLEYMPYVGYFFKSKLFQTTYLMPATYTNEPK